MPPLKRGRFESAPGNRKAAQHERQSGRQDVSEQHPRFVDIAIKSEKGQIGAGPDGQKCAGAGSAGGPGQRQAKQHKRSECDRQPMGVELQRRWHELRQKGARGIPITRGQRASIGPAIEEQPEDPAREAAGDEQEHPPDNSDRWPGGSE